MPNADGIVGFDRARLEQLRAATEEGWRSAAGIGSNDWLATDSMASLHAAIDFLAGPMRHAIDAMLLTDSLTRPVDGTERDLHLEFFGPTCTIADLDPVAIGDDLGSAANILATLGAMARHWPRRQDQPYALTLSDFTAEDQRWLRTLARRLRADPGLLGHVLDTDQDADAISLLGLLAATGALDAVASTRLLAAMSLNGVAPPASPRQIERHDSIIARLYTALDEVGVDPAASLAALEDRNVRTWLILDRGLDDDAAAFLIASGTAGAATIDESAERRSRNVWVSFADLAEEFGSIGFRPGAAAGLAIGAAAHLPQLLSPRRTDTAVTEAHGTVARADLTTLLGSIVVDETAAALFYELVHHTAVTDLGEQLRALDARSFDAESDRSALTDTLRSSVGLLDLIFDDAIDVQQARWNDIARAEASEQTQLITMLSTVTSLIPGGGPVTATAKTVFRAALGSVRSTIDDRAGTVPRSAAVDGFDAQLARELVASIADSPTLREIVRWDHLTEQTRQTLGEFARHSADVEVTSLAGLLTDLGLDATDARVIGGQINDLVEPVREELEPHRD